MLKDIWLLMLCLGVLLFLVSIVLTFVWKVPELLDELSGRKAKRQVKRLKEINAETGTISSMVTGDFYLTDSSNLRSESKELVSNSGLLSKEKSVSELNEELGSRLESIQVEGNIGENNKGVIKGNGCTSKENIENLGSSVEDLNKTSILGNEEVDNDSTNYIDEDSEATGLLPENLELINSLEDDNATGILEEVDEDSESTGILQDSIKVIKVIKEQSNIL